MSLVRLPGINTVDDVNKARSIAFAKALARCFHFRPPWSKSEKKTNDEKVPSIADQPSLQRSQLDKEVKQNEFAPAAVYSTGEKKSWC